MPTCRRARRRRWPPQAARRHRRPRRTPPTCPSSLPPRTPRTPTRWCTSRLLTSPSPGSIDLFLNFCGYTNTLGGELRTDRIQVTDKDLQTEERMKQRIARSRETLIYMRECRSSLLDRTCRAGYSCRRHASED